MRMQMQDNGAICAKQECQQKAYLAAMEDRSVGQQHLDKESITAPTAAITFVVFATPNFYFCMDVTDDLVQPVHATNTRHIFDDCHKFDNDAFNNYA